MPRAYMLHQPAVTSQWNRKHILGDSRCVVAQYGHAPLSASALDVNLNAHFQRMKTQVVVFFFIYTTENIYLYFLFHFMPTAPCKYYTLGL